MAHSSCLGLDRTCDHAVKAAQHLRTTPAGSGIGRRHRMGASLGGPQSPALVGHQSRASPQPAPTVADQRCPGARGRGIRHSGLLVLAPRDAGPRGYPPSPGP